MTALFSIVASVPADKDDDTAELKRLLKQGHKATKSVSDDWITYTVSVKRNRPPLSVDAILNKIFVWPSPTNTTSPTDDGVEYFGQSVGCDIDYAERLLKKEKFKQLPDEVAKKLHGYKAFQRGNVILTMRISWGTRVNSIVVGKV